MYSDAKSAGQDKNAVNTRKQSPQHRNMEGNEATCSVTRKLLLYGHVNRMRKPGRMNEGDIRMTTGGKTKRSTSIDVQKFIQKAMEGRNLEVGGWGDWELWREKTAKS